MLLGLTAMLTLLWLKFSCRKNTHFQSNKTFIVLMFVAVKCIGMYILIIYEMARTVNALKFHWTTFLSGSKRSLEGIHFCTFNTTSHFPISMLFSVQSASEMKGTVKLFECKSNIKKAN